MQTLPSALVDRLRAGVDPSFVIEDFVFAPDDFPSLAGQRVIDDRVVVYGTPRLVHRTVHTGGAVPGVEIGLWLGVEGAGDAFDALLAFVGGFSRTIPVGDIAVLQDEPAPIGDTGLAWPWVHGDPPATVAWMRGNVLVTLTGGDAIDPMATAREIDAVLAGLDRVAQPVSPYYRRERPGAGEPERLTVAPAGRVSLRVPPDFERESLFFFAERGSVNVDPDAEGDAWYYRAGLDPAESVGVDALAVGRGLVPDGVRLSIHVA